MKLHTVLILWVITILLGITSYIVKFKQSAHSNQTTQLVTGDTILKDLPIREVARITLTQGDQSTELLRLSDNIQQPLWGVANRENYNINYDLLRNLLGSLNQIKVSQSYPCEVEHHNKFGLMKKSDDPKETGTHITTYDKSGKKLSEVLLGKYSGNGQANGRFVRIVGDDTGVYSVRETFPGVTAAPQDWLDKAFFKINDIKNVTLSAPNDPAFTPWKLVKKLNSDGTPAVTGQIILDGMTENEVMKLTSTNDLKKIFSSTRFRDVLSTTQAAEVSAPDKALKRSAIITTEDGITYNVTFWPQKSQPKQDQFYLLTVDVSLNTPSPSAEVTAKVNSTLPFKGKIYQVRSNTVSPLLKERSDFISTIPKR